MREIPGRTDLITKWRRAWVARTQCEDSTRRTSERTLRTGSCGVALPENMIPKLVRCWQRQTVLEPSEPSPPS